MEGEEEREIVGMIRGCIKTVTCGKKLSRSGKDSHDPTKPVPVYTKLAYILGLRVSPSHRYHIKKKLPITQNFTKINPSTETH